MPLRYVLGLCAASLFFVLPGCGTTPAEPDAAVDGAIADAGRDATTPPGDAGPDEDAAVAPDGGDDAAVDLDGGDDASVEPDGSVSECSVDLDCDDGDACTVDTCTSGVCDSAPIDPDDGDVCTDDSCDPTSGPAHVAVSTDDGDVCTADACDATAGVSHTPIDDCCETSADCASGVCSGNVCQPASCTDGVQNGTETDVDCGGACPPCALSQGCALDGDCQSDACVGGSCVECASAATCPGADTECRTRTCIANACGFAFTAAGTATSSQVVADCHQSQCDGAGNVFAAVLDTDLPVDGNPCTGDVCTAGVPSNPPAPASTPCAGGGGALCDGAGACVECVTASDCPGSDTDCRTRTCTAGACGVSFAPAGTPTTAQIPGDCQQTQCDGAGASTDVASDGDLPADDGNQCTSEACAAGVPTHPSEPGGTACSQSGGVQCDGAGACVAPPAVAATSPADGSSVLASTTIAVTFTTAMSAATLTAQTTAGPCSGSIQVSLDDFATCVAFASASAAMSAGDTIATLTPAPGLLVNRTYAIRVTTAATSAAGLALPAQHTQAMGFATGSPEGSVVIAQVYGAGGNSGALYRNDYVVLHNRASAPVSLAGWSIQYASATGSSWTNITALSGTIPASGYYLVQLASGGANGSVLPTADATGTTNMSGTAGKVALVDTTTALTGACPTGSSIVDFVGFGTTASCFEGAAAAPAPSSTLEITRTTCVDAGANSVDFTTGAPTPRSSASPISACPTPVWNESGAALEADYCTIQFPLSLDVTTGTSTGAVYGRLFEAGVTEAAGAGAAVRAQLGYGPASANPEYQAGWIWTDASFNTQVGNDDEYQASFTAPAVGSYRYAYRVSLDGGASWTLCDQHAGDFGAGSNAGLTFDLASLPVLTVAP